MRNPNGFGGITKLSGNRRNPFRVRITKGWEFDEKTGKHKQLYVTLGYFPTRKDAMLALANYNQNPYDIDVGKVTFQEIYMRWIVTAAEEGTAARRAYSSAFKKLAPLHEMKMSDLRKAQLQNVLNDNNDLSKVYLTRMRGIIKNVFNYCIENDILLKDYSQFLTIGGEEAEAIHKPYTTEEIKTLWQNVNLGIPLSFSKKDVRDVFPVDIILIGIYTGMRPGEVLKIETENIKINERYLIGGSKTDSGKNRVIPIHKDIVPLIEKRLSVAGKYLLPYKSDSPAPMNAYRKYLFDTLMKELNMSHLPHDGRHTFATFADKYINEYMIKRIMGHKIDDLTQGVYTHVTNQDIVNEIDKIIFYEK